MRFRKLLPSLALVISSAAVGSDVPGAGAAPPATGTVRAAAQGGSAGSPATYRVFATTYAPHTQGSVEVAVPDKCAKFAALRNSGALLSQGCPAGYSLGLDYRVVITRDSGQSAVFPVREVGPWNQDDNYWGGGPGSARPRRLFTDLPRGLPEAQAAFSNGYNPVQNCKNLDGSPSGRTAGADQFGRCVLNPAGVDLSYAAAAQLGMNPGDNQFVTVSFLWEPLDAGGKPSVVRGNVRHLRQSRTSGPADFSFTYGNAGDVAVTGDWDGNGSRTPGVFRNGTWYLRNTNIGGGADITFGYGSPGDVPVVGDWNQDGIETVGVFRGGRWYLRNSNTGGNAEGVFTYGDPTDTPVVGDWNQDGTDTLGVFRGGLWYLTNRFDTGAAEGTFRYGNPSDTPVVGDWNSDRTDTLGVVRGGTWYLSDFFDRGAANIVFSFGDPSDRPRVWR